MTRQTYDVIAWCDRTYYAQVSVEAESAEQALQTARHGIHDADGEECGGAWEWDRFRVEDAGGNIVLEHQEEHIRLWTAARAMLAALRALLPYAENEVKSLRECLKGDGLEGEISSGEAALEQARTAIAQAEGRAA